MIAKILCLILAGMASSLVLIGLIWVQDQRIIRRLDRLIQLLGGDQLRKDV